MPTQSIEHITVEVDGTGDSVIMIHGLGGTSNTWTPQMSLFVDGYQSVRPDLPGAGRTPPGTFVSIETLVECVSDIARSLGIRNAHVLGHSMGTIVCQHLAVANPSLVRSLALFGPSLNRQHPRARRCGIGPLSHGGKAWRRLRIASFNPAHPVKLKNVSPPRSLSCEKS